jgi:predicted nucleic acid-binding protein
MRASPRARAPASARPAAAARRVLRVAPPTALRMRHPVVVDCGVLAAVLFDEAERDAALRRLAGAALHAPWLLDFEIASAAAHAARAGRGEVAARGLADYRALAIERVPVDPFAQAGLAMSYGITTYDAAYLWLAAALRAPLVTFDAALARAARRHLGADAQDGR